MVKNLGASSRGILRELNFDFEASLKAFKSRLSSKKGIKGDIFYLQDFVTLYKLMQRYSQKYR